MRKGLWCCLATVFLTIATVLLLPLNAYAETVYTNPDTGYDVILEDSANLLSEAEEASLLESMKEISAYGNVGFKTINYNETTAEAYLEEYYQQKFGRDSGIIFLIDMDNRKIWLKDDGSIERTIGASYLDTITDNCYRYASAGKYSECAGEVFLEIGALLEGQRIAQPMKYVSNALLALVVAMLINFCILKKSGAQDVPDRRKILAKTKYHIRLENPRAEFVKTTKRHAPRSSDSSGSSDGSSGGGGGSSSGSSGGHSF